MLCLLLICYSNLFQDRRIEELTLLLSQFREMNDIMTLVQGKFFKHVLPCFISLRSHQNHFEIDLPENIYKTKRALHH